MLGWLGFGAFTLGVVLVALAAGTGVFVPPLIASARVVWPHVVGAGDLPAAYGLQAPRR